MIILEEWTDYTKQYFEDYAAKTPKPSSIFNDIRKIANELDLRELDEYPGARKKISLFLNHYRDFEKLSSDSRKKRLSNASLMLKKLEEEYLFPTPLQKKSDDQILNKPLKNIKGVGPKRADKFKALGLETVKDLLFYFPRGYDDRRRVLPISKIIPADRVTVIGKIHSISATKTRSRMNILTIQLVDDTGVLTLKWFNQPYLNRLFKEGQTLSATGKVKSTGLVTREMMVNEFELINADNSSRKIYPVYPLTAGLYNGQIRAVIDRCSAYAASLRDALPQNLIEKKDLLGLQDAVYGLHNPKSNLHIERCGERIKFDELFYFELATYFAKMIKERRLTKKSKPVKSELSQKLIKRLPFELTNAQKKVFERIKAGLKKETLMNLLIQGDVGSGKTIVALLGILETIDAGYQGCIMAPTSILATQHYQGMVRLLGGMGLTVDLLLSKTPAKEKREIKERIASGESDIIIGTHAIIQKDVAFKKLGLAIIDEQHRFGVRQRETLIKKGEEVDTIVMTATPIPRTLSLSVFGDLDIASIDEMPPGRKPVRTMLIPENRKGELYDFLEKEITNDGQIYIVYPLVEESEALDLKDATSMYEVLQKTRFRDFNVGLLHGKMKAEEKDDIMQDFIDKKYDILVSTTVIEVGIDVPSATVMVIEHPERFGLAQLHQLRGRVGRNKKKGYCFLVTADKSKSNYERLDYFASHNSGFDLSEYDLEKRGPGEVMGVRQHGMPSFKLADIVQDREILFDARKEAVKILKESPDLEDYKELKAYIEVAYKDRMNLIDVG
jgi:ATP-dependent DNA helicase RecG